MRKYVKMNDGDNVAIVVNAVCAGEELCPGIYAASDIPQGHKFALEDIPAGGAVTRYGVTLGYLTAPVARGGLVNETNLALPEPPELSAMPFAVRVEPSPLVPRAREFMGYSSPDGSYAGTRNLLAIHTTVQCVTGVVNVAVERIRKELLPMYPHVDGVVPINHEYGCGVAIDSPEAAIPTRTLRNLVRHPNFGGEVMCVALGCEKLTPDMLLDGDNAPENVIVLQELNGFEAMLKAIIDMACAKLARLERRRRTRQTLDKLMVGMQCGGSDAFSGVSANPAAGYASDLLVNGGATVLFSEVTEVRDGAHLLAERCVDERVGMKFIAEMRWYDEYLARFNTDRSANPSPGNKLGGLSNIVEKALGCIAKSGASPIVDVLAPAERPSRGGLIFASTPASDIVCGPCQLASGMGVQVFMTGRGTPYGLAAAPVIKVSSRSETKARWSDLIDVDAGPIATGDATIAEIGQLLFDEILAVASGEKKPFAELHRLCNDLCLFNTAPLT